MKARVYKEQYYINPPQVLDKKSILSLIDAIQKSKNTSSLRYMLKDKCQNNLLRKQLKSKKLTLALCIMEQEQKKYRVRELKNIILSFVMGKNKEILSKIKISDCKILKKYSWIKRKDL